ncbi:MAG: HEPN domain-containing protein [Candidatus ainarchaeum sp.]|nr:HEPN domain-containing protein [Candidatus ainarchaeum sp.]
MDFDFLVAMGSIARIEPSRELCEKEMREAEYDLNLAAKSFSEGDFKWSIVKSYYSMFHGAKGALFLMGFREKSHRGMADALDVLCRQGKLESRFANDFRAAMSAREGADYTYSHSRESAQNTLAIARDFVARIRELAKAKPETGKT